MKDSPAVNQSLSARVTAANQKWDSSTSEIFMYILTRQKADLGMCSSCNTKEAVVLYTGCVGWRTTFCDECDDVGHKFLPFHDRLASYCGFLQPISPLVEIKEKEFLDIGKFYEICCYLVSFASLFRLADVPVVFSQ